MYKHWPGKTITEADDHLFCMITMNHHPLHTDAWYGETQTQFGKNVVVGNLVYSLVLGMSVADVSGAAIANLEIESLQHKKPTFHGDTIYAETLVLDKMESSSRNDRGVVTVETRGVQPARRRGLLLPPQGDGAQARGGQAARAPVHLAQRADGRGLSRRAPDRRPAASSARSSAGEQPAHVVLDTPAVVAFLDHRPLFPGHTLVVPRAHVATLTDLPPDALGGYFARVQQVDAAVEDGHGRGRVVRGRTTTS